MKKRMVPIVMAVVMALSLTACGKEKTVSLSEVSETSVSSVEDKEEAVEKEAPAKEEVATEASVETVAETSVEASETEEDEVVFLGRVEDGAYINDFYGIKITPAEGVIFADDNMLGLLNNIALEKLSNSDSKLSKLTSEMLKNGQNVIDSYAYEGMGLNSLNVTVAYIGEGVGQDFAYALAEMTASSAKQIFGAQGMDVQSSEASTMEISGKEIPCVKTVAKVETNGATVDTYILQGIIIKDGYGATLTAGSYLEDNTDKQFEMVTLFE